jgi:hypothetical protein
MTTADPTASRLVTIVTIETRHDRMGESSVDRGDGTPAGCPVESSLLHAA